MSTEIDEIDIRILEILQHDSAASQASIARQIGIAPSAIHARIRQLEADGIIQGYEVRIDMSRLGYPLLAFVFVSEAKPVPPGKTLRALHALNLAEEMHRISGDDCFLLKIRARDTNDLREKLDDIGTIKSVGGVRTHLVLQSAQQELVYSPAA